ncbi:hypothetical protein ACWFOS_14675 [Gordonia terrae]
MDPEHEAMVELATRWLPFGGPPASEILVTFGLNSVEFYRRILTFAGNPAAPEVSRSLQLLARQRIHSLTREPAA